MRLVFPALNDTVLVDIPTGVVFSGPITISADTDFRAEFLRADSMVDPRVTDPPLVLQGGSRDLAVVGYLQRPEPFQGRLQRRGPGTTAITFYLFHPDEHHSEFIRAVPVTVN